jgi:magnesium chelatase subunit D
MFSAEAIAAARARLAEVEARPEAVEALVAVAARLGVASLRGPLFALRAARALAALGGRREIEDEDLGDAASLTLAPRATQAAEPPQQAPQPEEGETPPPPENEDGESDAGVNLQDLQDVVLAAARAAIPPDVMAKFAATAAAPRRGATDGKSGTAMVSKTRGSPLEPRPGRPREGRVDLLATLRAAAPWQRLRARESASTARLHIRTEDIRIVRYRQRRGATAVFVVDASGSSAMQRLGEVKGAIELLLADCYVRRDSVALIAFRARSAELVLPPTRSIARARRTLAGLPGGGGTPVAAGIDAALTLSLQIERKGQTPLLVLMTDGRANIARDGTAGRPRANEDALEAGRRVRAAGISALAIDTSGPSRGGEAPTQLLAEAMHARYLRLPFADSSLINEAVRAAAAS